MLTAKTDHEKDLYHLLNKFEDLFDGSLGQLNDAPTI